MGRAGCSVIYRQRQQLTNCSSHGWVPVSLRIVIREFMRAQIWRPGKRRLGRARSVIGIPPTSSTT